MVLELKYVFGFNIYTFYRVYHLWNKTQYGRFCYKYWCNYQLNVAFGLV